MCCTRFDAIDPGTNLPFGELFLPFQISDHIRKAFISNKNEGNNKKVGNKVSGMLGYVQGGLYFPNTVASI